MAQFEKELHDADFYTVLSLLEKEILASGASVELVGTARYDLGIRRLPSVCTTAILCATPAAPASP